MADTYAVPIGRGGVVNISCGQMVEPGEQTSNVDPDNPHDAGLIEDGRLVKIKNHEVTASLEAKELAEEEGIDLSSVNGSGAGGNIVVDDVRKAAEAAEEEDEEEDD